MQLVAFYFVISLTWLTWPILCNAINIKSIPPTHLALACFSLADRNRSEVIWWGGKLLHTVQGHKSGVEKDGMIVDGQLVN